MRWPRSIELASAGLPLTAGLILALLTLALGPKTLPIVLFGLFMLPWLMKDVFRLFVWLIVTWPILTLFVRIPLPAGVPDISYERVLVPLILGFILLEALVSKRRLLRVGLLDILVLGFAGAQLSSRVFALWFGGIGSPDLIALLDYVFVPLATYWMTKNLLVSRAHLRWLLYAIVIACLLICLSGLYEQAVGGEQRLFTVSPSLGGSAEQQTSLWLDVPGGRAAGALGNPAVYGATLGMGILASLVCVAQAKQKRTQAALVATIMVLLCGVFASYTRSAWISVGVALFFAQFLIGDFWKKTLPISLVGVLLLVLVQDHPAISSVMTSRALEMTSVVPRLELAQLGWDRFLERPLLGWGSGALDIFGLRQLGVVSHNMFLTFLVDGGLVLFSSFSAVLVYLLTKAIRDIGSTEKNSFDRNVSVAAIGCILVFLMSGLALELRYFGYFNALFWIFAGIIDRPRPKSSHEGQTWVR